METEELASLLLAPGGGGGPLPQSDGPGVNSNDAVALCRRDVEIEELASLLLAPDGGGGPLPQSDGRWAPWRGPGADQPPGAPPGAAAESGHWGLNVDVLVSINMYSFGCHGQALSDESTLSKLPCISPAVPEPLLAAVEAAAQSQTMFVERLDMARWMKAHTRAEDAGNVRLQAECIACLRAGSGPGRVDEGAYQERG